MQLTLLRWSLKISGIYNWSNIEVGIPYTFHGENISSKIGVFRWLKCILPANTLTMLYSAIVLPHFDYADSVYDSCTDISKTWLQSLQSRTARLLTGYNIQTHRADMFKDLCWMSLQHRRDMNKCILMYKCLNNLSPCYLTDMLQTNNNIHQYRTWQSNNLHLDKSKLEYYNGNFTITGAKLWNSLPQNGKDMPTLDIWPDIGHTNSSQISGQISSWDLDIQYPASNIWLRLPW